MKALIKKYLNVEKIEAIAKDKNYDEISYNEFIRNIEKKLIKQERVGFIDEWEAVLLSDVDKYMSLFVAQRNKGFSVEWAKEYAHRCTRNEEEDAAAYAFAYILNFDDKQAMEDLKLYAKLTKRDNRFVEHFEFLVVDDVPNQDIPVEKRAINYSETYKQQIEQGKSKSFAKAYAFWMSSEEFSEFRSYIAASEYERAIKSKNENSDALDYSDRISGYISEHYSTYEESLQDELANKERKRLMKDMLYRFSL